MFGFDSALPKFSARAVSPVGAEPVAAPKPQAVSTYQADTFVRTGSLPAQLQPLVQGQSAHFQRKSAEYYDQLVKQGSIDPKTVTAAEFVQKAERLAKHDLFAFSWLHQAWNWLTAQHLFQDILHTAAAERREREQADNTLALVREIGNRQAEERKQAIKADELVLSRRP